MSQQRSPDIGVEVWAQERAEAGSYDPSLTPEDAARVSQGHRRIARKRGRRAMAEALLAAWEAAP